MKGGALRALGDGAGRVWQAPIVLAGVWLASLLVGLVPALVVREDIASHLGASLEAERDARGVNYDWLQEFVSQAGGPSSTLTPVVIGFAAVLDNASAFLDHRPRPLVVTAAAGASVVLWLFLSGGIIDRYARMRPTGASGFFGVTGAFFFRFLRLGVVALAVYASLFRVVHPWLFERVYEGLIRDVTVERTAFLIRLGLYLPFVAAVAATTIVFDYAKVRAVVEDRRSMIGALLGSARFLSRHGGTAVALYLVNMGLLGVAMAGYAFVAPGAGSSAFSMWAAFAIGQVYLVGRLAVKLTTWASATALFQSRLAHAGYVATPLRRWPDSPAAAAVRYTSANL